MTPAARNAHQIGAVLQLMHEVSYAVTTVKAIIVQYCDAAGSHALPRPVEYVPGGLVYINIYVAERHVRFNNGRPCLVGEYPGKDPALMQSEIIQKSLHSVK